MVGEGEQGLADMAGDVNLAQAVGDDIGIHQPLPQHAEVTALFRVRWRRPCPRSAHHLVVPVPIPFGVHGELEVFQAMVLGQIGREGTQRPGSRGRIGQNFAQRRSSEGVVEVGAMPVVIQRSDTGGSRGQMVLGGHGAFVVGVPAGKGDGRSRRILGGRRGQIGWQRGLSWADHGAFPRSNSRIAPVRSPHSFGGGRTMVCSLIGSLVPPGQGEGGSSKAVEVQSEGGRRRGTVNPEGE